MTLRPNYDDDAVRDGALLRIASDLLVPYGELGLDRFQLIEWLAQLGIAPGPGANIHGWFWVQDACPDPEPKDDILILRRAGDEWIVGYWERGRFEMDAPRPGIASHHFHGDHDGSATRTGRVPRSGPRCARRDR